MKKKILFMLILCIFLTQNYGVYFRVSANDLNNENDIYYFTDKNIDNKIISTDIKERIVKGNVVKIDINDFKDYNSNKIVWLDYNKIRKSEKQNNIIKNEIIKMYNAGQTIVIRKDDICKKEVLEYLGIYDNFGDEQIDRNLKRVAVLIRKIGKNGYDIIGLNVYNYNEDIIEEGMLYMSKSDFNLRMRKEIIDKQVGTYSENTILRMNLAKASEWKSVKVDSNIDLWDTVKIQWTVDLKKDPDSPTNGQYRSYHKARVEAETTKSIYKIKDMYIYQDGGGKTKIYDYEPQPSSTSLGQVSLSYPWGVSFTYDLGSNAKIEKNAGGIGSSYVELRFINTIPTTKLNGIVTTEQFHQGTSYYSSGIRYIVNIKREGIFPVDNYATARASHYVGGY